MTNKKKKAIPIAEKSKIPNMVAEKLIVEQESDDFDFGGFPKDINLKKNIGCGG